MSVVLRRKVRRLRRLKAEIQTLEREVLEQGFVALQRPGETLLMKPRIERVMELFS